DAAAAGLDADDAPVGTGAEARYLAVLDDVDAERIRRARVAPGDGVVARGAGAALEESAQHRIAGIGRHVEERQPLGHLVAAEELGIDPIHVHGVDAELLSRDEVAERLPL